MDEKQNLRSQIASLGQPSPYSESQRQQFTIGQVSIGAPVSRAEFEKLERRVTGLAARMSLSHMILQRACGQEISDRAFELMEIAYRLYDDNDPDRSSEIALAAVPSASE